MIAQNTSPGSQDNSVRWWLPERVIYVGIQEDITSVTADWRLHQLIGLIHTCPTQRVHVIIEVQPGHHLPNVFHPVSRRLIAQPRRGWVVTIVDYPAWQRHLLNFLTRLTYLRYDFCATRQAAFDVLQRHDPTLPQLSNFEIKN